MGCSAFEQAEKAEVFSPATAQKSPAIVCRIAGDFKVFSLIFQIDRPQIQQVAAGEANLLVQVGVD